MTNIQLHQFDNWNNLKKNIQERKSKIYFKESDIWWVSIGQNIKSESYWKGENFRRPVLILKKLSNDTCICIPLSSQTKKWTWFAPYKLHGKEATALLYQVKMIHKNRFQRKIGQLDEWDFANIKKRLKELLNL